ncbi:MAG: BTAD domain-containing putative transcriptional regulator [Gemmatimonadaceae bacterium]
MPHRPPADRLSPTPDRLRHNVPVALSSFVGRSLEVGEVRDALSWSRLVTVAGAGGAGKTRLVREVAAAIVRDAAADDATLPFPDGILWVELAPVSSGEDVAATLAALLDITPSSGKPLVDAVVDALRSQRLLVVLDNCEHVIHEAAALADALLRGAPHLTIAATSREALAIDGEVVWPMPGLTRWEPGDAAPHLDAAHALDFDAIRLFVERARAATPSFALTDANAESVATICTRLDGLPLALELAAAIVPVLGIDALVARLDDALSLLARGKRTSIPRHRTMRAVLDWSYELLGPEEQALLRRLSVFRGAFTLEDVEAVCAPSPGSGEPRIDVLTALGRLVELSLMEVREDEGEANYRLLETVRQYGATLLRASPHEREVRARHARWVAEVAERVEPMTFSPARGRIVWRQRRAVEEIRAALHWATAPDGDPVLAFRIGGALGWYWISLHPWGEARALLRAALAAADAQGIADADRPLEDRVALGRMMYPMLGLAYFAGDTDAMLAIAAREEVLWDSVDATPGLTDAQRLSSARGRTLCYQLTGLARAMRGEAEVACRTMNRCVATAERSGDRWLLAVMMMRRALGLHILGDFTGAQRDFASSIAPLTEMGEHWFLSLALEGMAINALALGDIAAAGAYARESVTVLRPEPDAWFISRSLDAIAVVLEARIASGGIAGDDSLARATVAARLMGAAAGLRRRCGAGIIGPDVKRHAATLESLRARLGAARFDAAHAEGERWTLPDVFAAMERDPIIAALAEGSAPPPSAPAPSSATRAARTLEVSLLGGVSIVDGGVPLANDVMPAGKMLELLVFLLLHRGATKDEVGVALWPDASAAQVRNIFHVTLHHLRRALGSTRWITFDRNLYTFVRTPEPGRTLDLDVDAVLDASAKARAWLRERTTPTPEQYTEVRRALSRNRGPLARGFVKEDWIVAHQDHVQGAWAEGMDALAQLAFGADRFDEAASALEALIRQEPLRESAHRLYLRTLAARGEPARALVHYGELSNLLQRELGARPARETREIAERLRG